MADPFPQLPPIVIPEILDKILPRECRGYITSGRLIQDRSFYTTKVQIGNCPSYTERLCAINPAKGIFPDLETVPGKHYRMLVTKNLISTRSPESPCIEAVVFRALNPEEYELESSKGPNILSLTRTLQLIQHASGNMPNREINVYNISALEDYCFFAEFNRLHVTKLDAVINFLRGRDLPGLLSILR